MNILAIESSCDETAAAVVQDGKKVLSSIISSQVDIHALYGGVVPEIASRKHLEVISIITKQALAQNPNIDAVAVTAAPGLIGALLVGVNYAKSYALARGLPLIPVHHIRGHIAAAYLEQPDLKPPFLALVVSGGHTMIIDVMQYTSFRIIATTRDDAAGEAFDKIARVLGLGYPGGVKLSQFASTGQDDKYKLPNAMKGEMDMSFSGLKTAIINIVHQAEQKGLEIDKASLAACFEKAVCDTIIPRIKLALNQTGYKNIVVVGGVAANNRLRSTLTAEFGQMVILPALDLCGDNAAMIAAQAFCEYNAGIKASCSLNAIASFSVQDDWSVLCK